MTKVKKTSLIINIVLFFIVLFAQLCSWVDVITWLTKLVELINEKKGSYPILTNIVSVFLTTLFPYLIIELISNMIEKAEMKKKKEAEKAEMKKREEAEKAEMKKKEEAEKAEMKKKEEAEKAEMMRHFPHSLRIVYDSMIPTMKAKVKQPNSCETNNQIDSIIQSPIEYAKEIVTGNQVPSFKPDDSHQDNMFNPSVKYIVAITAENPNLWMDPTVCFYMANCYAVSLMNQTNRVLDEAHKANKRISRVVVRNRDVLENTINDKRKEIIDKLCDKQPVDSFEFIRIFMFTEDQNKSCENAVFPSLKASQDLFRTYSFYINKNNMEETIGNQWGTFSEIVTRIWSIFEETTFNGDGRGAVEVLKTRKEKIIPEFLLLYYDNKIELLSYLDGTPVKAPIKKGTKYETFIKKNKGCSYKKKSIMKDINNMLKLLSSYVKERDYKDDLTFENNPDMVNKNNTFIDWEIKEDTAQQQAITPMN